MRKSSKMLDNMYLTPVVPPSDSLQDQKSLHPYDNIDESSMQKSTDALGSMYLTLVVPPSDASQDHKSLHPYDNIDETAKFH